MPGGFKTDVPASLGVTVLRMAGQYRWATVVAKLYHMERDRYSVFRP